AGNVQRIPSGPEATQLQSKAGYMYATFPLQPIKLNPCNAGRTIYVTDLPVLLIRLRPFSSTVFERIIGLPQHRGAATGDGFNAGAIRAGKN
ncbi:MAG: hypothetical protein R8K46_05325, partial [Mariprofundaceae bacterium]